MDSLEMIGAQSFLFIDEKIEKLWALFLQSLSSKKLESKRTKEEQVIIVWLPVIFFIRETVDCTIFQKRLGYNCVRGPHTNVFEKSCKYG